MKNNWKDAIKHLRLHFSLLLLPIFLFSLSQASITIDADASVSLYNLSITFIVLHLLVYPASNVFNSYYDVDKGSVGGLKNPPPVNDKMLVLANILDATAILLCLSISVNYAALIFLYIVASRLYSYRPIRLKKYAILGFLVIFVFQGSFTFYASIYGFSSDLTLWGFVDYFIPLLWAGLACSFQIGAIYPLTQIYQHQSDLEDGVTTLSYRLGYRGTFIFSGTLFSLATLFYYLHFKETDLSTFYLLLLMQFPVISFFLSWARLVWIDTRNANYTNTMKMNVIAAIMLNLFFFYLVISNR